MVKIAQLIRYRGTYSDVNKTTRYKAKDLDISPAKAVILNENDLLYVCLSPDFTSGHAKVL